MNKCMCVCVCVCRARGGRRGGGRGKEREREGEEEAKPSHTYRNTTILFVFKCSIVISSKPTAITKLEDLLLLTRIRLLSEHGF